MQNEKEKILKHRIIWSVVLAVSIIIDIIVIIKHNDDYFSTKLYLAMLITILPLSLFIYTLLLSYKTYVYNDKEIIVYAGFYHHYISVNGVIVDEYNTFTSLTPIWLSCTLADETYLQATISASFRRIALKINDKLYQEVR